MDMNVQKVIFVQNLALNKPPVLLEHLIFIRVKNLANHAQMELITIKWDRYNANHVAHLQSMTVQKPHANALVLLGFLVMRTGHAVVRLAILLRQRREKILLIIVSQYKLKQAVALIILDDAALPANHNVVHKQVY